MNILKNRYFQLSFLILLLYCLPWIVLGQNSYVLIHDNLDSNVVWFKTLAESGEIFASSSAIIPSLMDAPRASLGNEFSVLLWMNYIFDPYTAYVINQILMRITAFFGMYLLLNRYILKNENKYSILISLLFSLLPFWPSGGLSVAGMPLITYVFLNIHTKRDTKKDWLVLVLFPFYSSFVLSMMFYIIFVGCVWLYDIVKRSVSLRFTAALFLFGSIYLLINYRLIEVFIFGSDFVSQRSEFFTKYYGFSDALLASLKFFVSGQYHAASLHTLFLPLILVVFILNLFSKSKDKLLIGLFLLNILIALWYGFWKYEGWESIKAGSAFLRSLNLSRFHFLAPLIWYVLLALSIRYLLQQTTFKYKLIVINVFLGLGIIVMFTNSDFASEYKKHDITYKEFYAQRLFKEIDRFIGKKQSDYKVVSIGIHPVIARYNGFYTADGYLANYALSYKHQFRKVIENELQKSAKLKRNFDNWGSRCYLFCSEIGYNYVRKKDKVYPVNIDLNTQALKKMGVSYLFSSYPIKNASENNIKLLKIFKDKDAAWDIYLYKILETK